MLLCGVRPRGVLMLVLMFLHEGGLQVSPIGSSGL